MPCGRAYFGGFSASRITPRAPRRGAFAEASHRRRARALFFAAAPASVRALVDEARLLEKLRRIEALFAGAKTDGERIAAAEARARIQLRLAEVAVADPPVEYQFSLADAWSRKVFVALLRRYDACVQLGIGYTDTSFMTPREQLTAFDDFLTAQGLRLDAVVIGGAALNLIGIVRRPTKDCDILHPELSRAVANAARAFAAAQCAEGNALDDDWLNNGPSSLTALLPVGWQDRLQPAFDGRSIVLRCLGRSDLLCTKLFALCDRGFDLADCVALAPSANELDNVRSWLEQQDAHPGWPAHVRATLDDLGQRLGHGL